MVTLSVLLPTRDDAATLPQAVNCLLKQEGFSGDLEIILTDDGSQDDTLDIAHAWAARDPRVRILALPSRGLPSALNAGLAKARGRFIARMDADDLCPPDRLVRQMRHMRRRPNLSVVGTRVRLFPASAATDGMRAYVNWQNRLVTHRAMERNLLVESPLTHGSVLLRRESLEAVGGWRDHSGPEDQDLWLRGAAAGWRFGKVNRPLYFWRERADRATRRDPRYGRHRFRNLAMDAFAVAHPSGTDTLLWGWGESLKVWRGGLAQRGMAVDAVEVNPRRVRGGDIPPLPKRGTTRGASLSGGGDKRPAWLLAYGSEKSRDTLTSKLSEERLRPGWDYRFVS